MSVSWKSLLLLTAWLLLYSAGSVGSVNTPSFSIGGITPGIRLSEALQSVPGLTSTPILDELYFHGGKWDDRKHYFQDSEAQVGVATSKDGLVLVVGGPVLDFSVPGFGSLRAGEPISHLKKYLEVPSPLERGWKCYSRYFVFDCGRQRIKIYHDWESMSGFELSLHEVPEGDTGQ